MADTGLMPTRTDVEHQVLHAVMDAADRRGVDHRPLSDIAASLPGLTWDQVADAYHDLVDADVLEIASTRKGVGHRVLEACSCDQGLSRGFTARARVTDNSAVLSNRDLGTEPGKRRSPWSEAFYHNALTTAETLSETTSQQAKDRYVLQIDRQVDAEAEAAEAAEAEAGGVRGGTLAGRRIAKARRTGPGPDSPMGLALYFEERLKERHPDQTIFGVNRGALARCFKEILKAGKGPDVARAMVDLFVLENSWVGKAPAFRGFLAARFQLMDKAERRIKEAAIREMSMEEQRKHYGPKPVRKMTPEEIEAQRFRYMTKAQRAAYLAEKGRTA